jgi:hypothetical protein
MKYRRILTTLAGLALTAWLAPLGQAVTITASETIRDTLPLDPVQRDLSRTRQDSLGYWNVENNDATIIAQNNVDLDFGILNKNDVSYTHRIDWLNPAAASIDSATLKITAFGALGNDDIVFVDTLNIGSLIPGSIWTLGFSTTVYSTTSDLVLDLILGDGAINVVIDKNRNAGLLASLNASSVFESTLCVDYSPRAVPEPGTGLASVGAGVMGLLGYLWRRRQGGSAV